MDSMKSHAADGARIRGRLFGPSTVPAQSEPSRAELDSIVNDVVFGRIWADATIPIQERSLMTLAVLAALGKDSQLAAHVRGARALGIPEDKLRALMVHVAMYAGVPTGYNSLAVVDRTLTELGTSADEPD